VGRVLLFGLTWSIIGLLILGNLAALAIAGPMVLSDLKEHGYSHPVGLYYPDTPLSHEDRVIWLDGVWLQLYWIGLWLTLMGSVVWLLHRHLPVMLRQLLEDFETRGSRPNESLDHQGFWRIMAGFFMFSAAISIAVLSGAEAGGADPEVLDLSTEPVWQSLFLLANASVWEEVMFRVMLIGVPLALLHLARSDGREGEEDALGATDHEANGAEPRVDEGPLWYHHLWGGVGAWDRPTLLLVAFSSFYFAYAHVGHGWDWFKVPGTFVAGVLFAYFYVRWSLPAAITFHFLFDYLGAFYLMEEAGLYTSWIAVPLVITGLGILIAFFCGLIVMVWLVPNYYRSLKEVLLSAFLNRERSFE